MICRFVWIVSLACACSVTGAGSSTAGETAGDRLGDKGVYPEDDRVDELVDESGGAPADEAHMAHHDSMPALGQQPRSAEDAAKEARMLGPVEYQARVGACRKVRIGTIARVLRGLGVPVDNDEQDTDNAVQQIGQQVGRMLAENAAMLGAPLYARGIPEAELTSVASAAALFDILGVAAPAVIAASDDGAKCGEALFAAEQSVDCSQGRGGCRQAGLSCLLGEAATSKHVALCNHMVCESSDPTGKGREIAVAALLAAALTCE